MPKLIPIYEKFKLFDIIGYTPHRVQREFHKSDARIKILRSGRRGGKSIAGAMDIMPIICTGGSRTWIVAPTYKIGEKEWRYIIDALFARSVFPNSKLKKYFNVINVRDNSTQGQMYLRGYWQWDIQNPIEIEVKSFDKPSGLLGEELDAVICSEGYQMPVEIWERYLRSTLTTRDGQVIFPSTACDDSDLLDGLWERGKNKRDKFVKCWEFVAYENPHWAPNIEEEKARLKRELTKEAYEEQVLGKKVHYEGRYYKEYDSEFHVKPIAFNQNKIIHRSWDFGYRHPCIIWCQINDKKQVCWLHTYIGTDMDDSELVLIGKYLSGQIRYGYLPPFTKERIQREKLSPYITYEEYPAYEDYCDAAGVQVKSMLGSSIKVLADNGIYPKYKSERTMKLETEPESIQIIRALLKPRHNNEPNLIIDIANELAQKMFTHLSYERKKDGSTTSHYRKEGFYEHPHDAFRYFVIQYLNHTLSPNRQRHRNHDLAYAA